tara:strand:- start:225 stop:431 length:207 start_codon:yes stop_codon:yes gene_type:complete
MKKTDDSSLKIDKSNYHRLHWEDILQEALLNNMTIYAIEFEFDNFYQFRKKMMDNSQIVWASLEDSKT